mmetsp:Transcript_2381/g.3400  ORF Transcript_2381/g.3400 Transcript_2381/m.3400 type:complete len:674 (+) Transcript_2381:54-2075(+)
MEGFLRKRGAKFKNWRKRYFIFDEGILKYSESPNGKQLGEGKFTIGSFTVPITARYGENYCFEVVCKGRTYILAADDALTYTRWMKTFKTYTDRLLANQVDKGLDLTCNITGTSYVKDQKKSWVVYNVSCDNCAIAWTVPRRYSQFAEFNKKILSRYSKVIKLIDLPSFPPATLGKASEQEVIRRRYTLEAYLHKILSVPELATCIEVLTFLGVARNNSSISVPESNQRTMYFKTLMALMDVGDVLLFKTGSIAANLQRIATRSPWDHVAFVMRIPVNSIRPASLVALEANARGIELTPLESILTQAQERNYTVAVRNLDWDLRNSADKGKDKRKYLKTLQKLTDFVDIAVYKPYSLRAIFSNKESNDGYFCSQLVAAAYKEMGIIPSNRVTQSYWPGTFAASAKKDALELLGARLGPEIILRFKEICVAGARLSSKPTSTLMTRSIRVKKMAMETNRNDVKAVEIQKRHPNSHSSPFIEVNNVTVEGRPRIVSLPTYPGIPPNSRRFAIGNMSESKTSKQTATMSTHIGKMYELVSPFVASPRPSLDTISSGEKSKEYAHAEFPVSTEHQSTRNSYHSAKETEDNSCQSKSGESGVRSDRAVTNEKGKLPAVSVPASSSDQWSVQVATSGCASPLSPKNKALEILVGNPQRRKRERGSLALDEKMKSVVLGK